MVNSIMKDTLMKTRVLFAALALIFISSSVSTSLASDVDKLINVEIDRVIKGDYVKGRQNLFSILEKYRLSNYGHWVVYNGIGISFQKEKKYQEAITYYTKAIEADPRQAKGYNNRGFCHRKLKQYREAIADHEKALKLAPNKAFMWDQYAIALYSAGEKDKARQAFEKALALDQDRPKTYGFLSYYWKKEGDMKKAKYYEDLYQQKKKAKK